MCPHICLLFNVHINIDIAHLNALEPHVSQWGWHNVNKTLCLYLFIQKQQYAVRTQNLGILGQSPYCPPCSSNLHQKHRLLSKYLPVMELGGEGWIAITTLRTETNNINHNLPHWGLKSTNSNHNLLAKLCPGSCKCSNRLQHSNSVISEFQPIQLLSR